MISPQFGGAIADWQGSFLLRFLLSAGIAVAGAAFSARLPDKRSAAELLARRLGS